MRFTYVCLKVYILLLVLLSIEYNLSDTPYYEQFVLFRYVFYTQLTFYIALYVFYCHSLPYRLNVLLFISFPISPPLSFLQVLKLLKALHVWSRFTSTTGLSLPAEVQYFGLCLLGTASISGFQETLNQSLRNATMYLDVCTYSIIVNSIQKYMTLYYLSYYIKIIILNSVIIKSYMVILP